MGTLHVRWLENFANVRMLYGSGVGDRGSQPNPPPAIKHKTLCAKQWQWLTGFLTSTTTVINVTIIAITCTHALSIIPRALLIAYLISYQTLQYQYPPQQTSMLYAPS